MCTDNQTTARVLANLIVVRYTNTLTYLLTYLNGSIAECLACWTQAQYGLGSNRGRDAVG